MRRNVALAVCLGVVLAVAVPQVAVASSGDADEELIAFGILEALAVQDKDARLRRGSTQIATGLAAGVIAGIATHALLPEFSQYALPVGAVVGAVGLLPGAITISRPTTSELALERVLAYPEDQREEQSVVALTRLADAAHEGRILTAIHYGAQGLASFASTAYLALPPLYYWGFYNLGMAGYTLFFPTREERALGSYFSLTEGENSE